MGRVRPGQRVRAVLRRGEEPQAMAALTALGPTTDTEPSLEDVFVSLARSRAAKGDAA